MSIIWWLIRQSKTEIKIVLASLAVLILLPVVSLVVLASSGISIVGSVLASLNPITHLVEIFDPDGNKVQDLELSTVWPTTGYISDEFGSYDEVRAGMGLGAHTGIDIANERGETGTPITPFIVGTVTQVHDVDDNDCGKYVMVYHEYSISSLYCHMELTATQKDAKVVPGDIIGYMGSTGASTGPHLHFSIMVYDIPVNPRIFMVGEPTGTYQSEQPTP